MSDATKRAMVEAMCAHAADVMDGAVLLDWVFVGHVPRFGEHQAEPNNYFIDGSSTAEHITRGLLDVGQCSMDGIGEDIDDD